MTPIVNKLLMDKKPIIPANLKPNVLAWWDARERGQVWYGLNQLVSNGNFVNTTGWINTSLVSFTVANNEASILADAQNDQLMKNFTTVAGHKYYGRAYVKTTSNTLRFYPSGSSFTTHSGSGNYELLSTIDIAAGVSGSVGVLERRTSGFDTVNIKNVMVYDLTAIFGAGNEPTAAEMDAILAADGNQYWEGTRQVLCNPDFKYYWKDYSGNGRHMKLNNFAYSGASGWQSPYGLGTDGIDDWLGRAESGLIPANHSFSVVTFISRPTGSGALITGWLYKTNYTTDQVFLPRYSDSSTAWACTIYDSVSGNVSCIYNTSITNNKVYYAVFTYNQTDKKVRIYVNNILVQTSNALANGNMAINYYKSALASSTYYPQKSCMEALLNKDLSIAEIKQIYEVNKRRFAI